MTTKTERLCFLNPSLRHKEWRKLAKKARRKRIRQKLAEEKDSLGKQEQLQREKCPNYQKWLKEQEVLEEHKRKEEERLSKEAHEKWLAAEEQAQRDWKQLQVKLEYAREERSKQQALIKAEWDKERKRLKDLEEKKLQEIKEKLEEEERLKQQIEDYIERGGELPLQLNGTLESNPNKEICPFFKKTAACRFGDSCSRNHVRPRVSSILLVPNFYTHISLNQFDTEHGNDTLEYDHWETYKHFKEFFYDVLPELEKVGEIKIFRTCCNLEPHLRGNVYVEYKNVRGAMKGYKLLQGRWYGGKQLNVEFSYIESWKFAICGLFSKNSCPKGSACNFLHVFRNPGDLYSKIKDDQMKKVQTRESSARHWRWSESPERIPSYHEKQCNGKHKTRKRTRSRSGSRSSRRSWSKSSLRSKKHERSNSKQKSEKTISRSKSYRRSRS